MHLHRTLETFWRPPRRWIVAGAATLAALLFVAAMIGARLSDSTEAQQVPQVRLWPPFMMTYTLQERNGPGGQLSLDQTRRLVVTSEYAWHEQVTRDSMKPERVGSTRELRDGVLHVFQSDLNYRQVMPLPSKRDVFAITPELKPTLLSNVRNNFIPSWRVATPTVAGRVAVASTEMTPCPQIRPVAGPCAAAGVASVTTDQRVEFDPRSLVSPFVGGVAVFGETRVNGQVVRTFRADSVEFP